MTNIIDVKSPVFSNKDNTQVNCIIVTDKGELPFTARGDDPETHGKLIFNMLISGKFGEISPYVEQKQENS